MYTAANLDTAGILCLKDNIYFVREDHPLMRLMISVVPDGHFWHVLSYQTLTGTAPKEIRWFKFKKAPFDAATASIKALL